ncbi:COX15/CtaA family protein [Kordiimonas sp. SCSIO 12610]|uniref:COX15/CtaA family protein n=1 Tax=Kordiimonas sp. SCSIO 12610 TaxID=2829597 RepID=UPI00210D2983|nr:COX15/CtaA family protein [Kordiimonas sp. SCSIO 12610]UTW53902.1 COX15/CtaA family protein [Kordiimonas sp. SCSIO 12610]
MITNSIHNDRRSVGRWLIFMAMIVALMVVVGGATRLTESGLSMVDWRPVTGVLPPIGESEWQAEFEKYQTSPEYQLKNKGMSLDEFKGIFYWEWGHRLLGRLIGLFFFLPLVWFWFKDRIPNGYKPRLVFLLIAGGSQGLLGWYMVQSGLVDEPAVSHYRLTAHLSLALFIFAALLWTAFSLYRPRPAGSSKGMKLLTHATMAVLVLQLVMGGLVAGLKAGHIFNTWPLMGETFVPNGLFDITPVWRNFLDNAITVQFDHRIGAYIFSLFVIGLFLKSRREVPAIKFAAMLVLLATALQFILGIIMLLKVVPVSWGTAHQGGGVVVLATMVYLMHLQRKFEAK